MPLRFYFAVACVVKFQARPGWCGPAALQNAHAALGSRWGQDFLADLAGTSDDVGTDEDGIMRAALATGLAVGPGAFETESEAWTWLGYALLKGRPVLLCVDRWDHWVVAVGLLGARVVLVDSSNVAYNRHRNGIVVLSRAKLMRRWYAGRRVRGRDGPAYYGIEVALA